MFIETMKWKLIYIRKKRVIGKIKNGVPGFYGHMERKECWRENDEGREGKGRNGVGQEGNQGGDGERE